MNTELSIPEQATAVEPSSNGYRNIALARLGDWAEQARAAYQVATSLCKTGFVPEAFRGKPEETTAAILAGAEVGLTPMAAIRSFDLIQGVAAPRALTLRAIVQSMGHQVIVDESTATRCLVRARRRGEHEWQKVSWTMDRAKQLGLAGKKNWQAQPQAMLVARATSEACRLIAADAILGIGYSVEEIGDGAVPAAPELAAESTPDQAGTRTMSRDDDGLATAAQVQKIGILCRELGYEDPAAARTYVGRLIGREIKSRKELSKDEASHVIETAQAQIDDQANLPGEEDPRGDVPENLPDAFPDEPKDES